MDSDKKLSGSAESLTFSMTPPILQENKSNNGVSDDSISEHLTLNSGGTENDRSFQEIEISYQPSILVNLATSDGTVNKSKSFENPELSDDTGDEEPQLQDTRSISGSLEGVNRVHSILEEILCNEQFQSDKDLSNNSKQESFNMFGGVNLDDKLLTNYNNAVSVNEENLYASDFQLPLLKSSHEIEKRMRDFEELIAVKESTIAALTAELDSVRDGSHTNTGSTLSTTEYKQLQEECHNKILEYNNEIVYKNDLIQKLSESLNQSVMERKDLIEQIDHFKEEITQLQEQLQDTTKMVLNHKCVSVQVMDAVDHGKGPEGFETDIALQGSGDCLLPKTELETEYLTLENTLNAQQKCIFDELKKTVHQYVENSIDASKHKFTEEIEKIKIKADQEKEEYDTEISRLRDLLGNLKCGSAEIMDLKNELESKHSREMEELRTYFEQKCADLEKNYSEEVFSQQSRKLSGSTCSDAELNSDLLYSHPPVHSTDMHYELQPNITKKDIVNLQNEMQSLLDKIHKFPLDSITDEDFVKLKAEIAKANLNNLLKYDLSIIRNDLQNKYHAELEVMREDSENKFDEFRLQYENKIQTLDGQYQEEVENLKIQLEDMQKQNVSLCSAVQEVRLVAKETDEEEWPSELLQLRDRFTEKYEQEIGNLKQQHQDEIEKLKEEHLRVLNGALERAKRRSLRDNDKSEIEILRERDSLKKQLSCQRYLVGELLKYYTQCEDELNNTLVDELLKQSLEKNTTNADDLDLNSSSMSSSSRNGDNNGTNVTRIHLTPNFNELISLIENNCKDEGDSKDISINLQNELGVCLANLKHEANAILAITTNFSKKNQGIGNEEVRSASIDEKINSLTRQIITEAQAKEKLKEELDELNNYVTSLEKEKNDMEAQLEQIIAKNNILEAELSQANCKIAELIENGHKEIVSEGYGDGSASQRQGESIVLLRDLQDKARNMLGQTRSSADPTLLQLIEDLCRIGERIKEESTREKQDLLQQIEVADKKCKATEKFLDDQANEREQERDEAQKKIDMLYGQLRERDKDKANCERVTSEVNGVCCRQFIYKKLQVEQLEHQLQQMTKTLDQELQRCRDLESERNEAVEKIKLLRDIIRDLEVKSETKSQEVNHLIDRIRKLECIVEEQEKSVNDVKQSNSSKEICDLNELYRHIEHLETELQQFRVNSELAGSDGVALQIKKQLFDLEQQIERRTKDLEILHSTEHTNCSSPSEDISARDVARINVTIMDECEVPLQQLARLKEKLVRHSRAEDAAVKRIRDLEMQVFGVKTELEEANNEKDFLKKQIQEQLVIISDLQIRLDEQRIRAEHIEKQTNTSLEMKIYDMTNEITSLRDKIHNKDKLLHQQQTLLTETQQRLKSMENEMNSPKEDELIASMQSELELLRKENLEMKCKIEKEAQIVPNIVGNIISDKNMDIEKLREKLDDTEKLLEAYTQLNLSPRELQTLSNIKNTGTSLAEVFSILDLSQADQVRHMDSGNSECLSTPNMFVRRHKQRDETLLEPELSAISPAIAHFTSHPRNSTAVSHKKVHFQDITKEDDQTSENVDFEDQLKAKDDIIKTYEERLNLLSGLENKIERLQRSLEETEKALTNATETFEKEQQELLDREKDLGVQLAEKKLEVEKQERNIALLEQDSNRKDDMCLSLTKEKRALEDALVAVQKDNMETIDDIIKAKNKEIEELQTKISSRSKEDCSVREEVKSKEMEIASLQKQLNELTQKYNPLQNSHKSLNDQLTNSIKENEKLTQELQMKMEQIENITVEHNNIREKLSKKRKLLRDQEDTIERQKRTITALEDEVKKLKEIVTDRECEIEIVNEDAKRYQNDIAALEYEIKSLKKTDIDKLNQHIKEKDAKINELAKEKSQMVELVAEKEKIINQMAEDSHQLHVNLMTIKNKIKEPGNILDLGNKLREEQKRNAELLQKIHDLKAQLLKMKSSSMVPSVEDITDQLRKELDYSAQIDSNIINAVSDHSLSSISETHDVEMYKKILAKEKTTKRQLLSQINALQAKNAELLVALDKERNVLIQVQTDDAKLIEHLRIQLDTLLDNEDGIRRALDEKNDQIKQLEDELFSLKRKNTVSSTSKTDSTKYKDLPSRSLRELHQLRKDYEVMKTNKNALLSDFILLKQELADTENALECAKQNVELGKQRENDLENQLQGMLKQEMLVNEELVQSQLRVEQLTDELAQQKSNFVKQKEGLMEQLKVRSQLHTENICSSPLPDELLEKIRELNSALLDNRKLMGIIQKLNNEKKSLENELTQLRKAEPEQVKLNELSSWSQYLFAKTLKLESIRKALIWQKRYMVDYVQSHDKHCLVQLFPDNNKYNKNFSINLKPKQHFRAAIYALISIHRMKYLVKRWHTGVRIAENMNSRHYRHLETKTQSKLPADFHVGQPVSSQLFSNIPTSSQTVRNTNPFVVPDTRLEGRPSTSKDEIPPWSGSTPPSKEQAAQKIRIGSNVIKVEEMSPLQAPQLLVQFIERFDQMQEKMGLVLDSNHG